jgi:hypothetical protein
LGTLHLLHHFGHHRRRDGHHPVIAAFGPSDKKRELFDSDVFDAQIERFTHPQPAAVKQADDQVDGITSPISDGLEQGLGFGHGGRVAHMGRAPGAEGINIFERLAEHLCRKTGWR